MGHGHFVVSQCKKETLGLYIQIHYRGEPNMKKSALAAAIALIALVLAGCAEATSDTSGKTGTNASVGAEPATDEEGGDKGDGILAFGETVNYDDGVSVGVGKPQKFKPSDTAFTDKAPAYAKFKVTIVNGTKEALDASLMYITVQSGDVEAAEVYDSEGGLNGAPQTKVLPGRQATYWVGFGVQNMKDIVMEVSDPLAHEPAIFTNVA